MRDDAHKWDSASGGADVLVFDELQVKHVQPTRQVMISGVRVLEQTNLTLVEWPDCAVADQYALVLRRDRILEINGPDRMQGWHEAEQQAVSDMSDGYSVLHVSGLNALPLLTRGGFVNTDEPSRSVARTLFDLPVLLYRHEQENCFRLHVGSGFLHTMKTSIVACHDSM